MHKITRLAVATAAATALTVPALLAPVSAAPSTQAARGVVTVDDPSAKKAPVSLKLKRAAKGVQPGIGKQKITALVNRAGKVKFTLKGEGITKNKKIKVKKGKAVYKVPPLGTGKYKVKASFLGKKDSIKFKVYNSALTVNSTTFTISASADPSTYPHLFGSVLFKDKPATTGYVDIYQDGKFKGGSESPYLLGFDGIEPDGTFNAGTGFVTQITKGYGLAGSNMPAFGPGTYQFQAYYTDGPEYADYISSNFITVVVTP